MMKTAQIGVSISLLGTPPKPAVFGGCKLARFSSDESMLESQVISGIRNQCGQMSTADSWFQ